MNHQKKGLIGSSSAFLEMMEFVSFCARHQRPVLVIGERGTGKEEIASRLHYLSPRWQQNLIKLNCAAFNDELLDSELFGHEAGSFTGARQARTGLFEAADGGTLFLDELGTMGPRLQEKLLRVTEYGELYRVGSSRVIKVDVRVVAATNDNLPQLAAQGRFRKDLLDRLAFDVITIPPLRARQEDILQLANHFAFTMARELAEDENDNGTFAGFSQSAIDALLSYHWPGNIRELKNAVERSVCHGGAAVDTLILDPFKSPWLSDLQTSVKSDGKHAIKSVAQGVIESHLDSMTAGSTIDLKGIQSDIEQQLVQHAMQLSQHHQKRAANKLGLSYDQLRALLRKHGKVTMDT